MLSNVGVGEKSRKKERSAKNEMFKRGVALNEDGWCNLENVGIDEDIAAAEETKRGGVGCSSINGRGRTWSCSRAWQDRERVE
jgi:hypothetical protein